MFCQNFKGFFFFCQFSTYPITILPNNSICCQTEKILWIKQYCDLLGCEASRRCILPFCESLVQTVYTIRSCFATKSRMTFVIKSRIVSECLYQYHTLLFQLEQENYDFFPMNRALCLATIDIDSTESKIDDLLFQVTSIAQKQREDVSDLFIYVIQLLFVVGIPGWFSLKFLTTHFQLLMALRKKPFKNTVGKGELFWKPAFSPVPTMFPQSFLNHSYFVACK